MLDWISDTVWAIVTYPTALFVEQDSPSFEAVRAMFGLILIAVVVYAIALMPRFGGAALKKLMARKPEKT